MMKKKILREGLLQSHAIDEGSAGATTQEGHLGGGPRRRGVHPPAWLQSRNDRAIHRSSMKPLSFGLIVDF